MIKVPTLDAARAFLAKSAVRNERRRSVPLSLISEGPVDRSVDKIGLKRPHTVHPSHALNLTVLLLVSFFRQPKESNIHADF